MPQNVPIPTGGTLPANLTALTDGDSNNGSNHLAVMEDVADAVGFLTDRAGTILDGDGGVLPDANYVILPAEVTARRTHFRIPVVAASRSYTLPTGTNGQSVVFRQPPNDPNIITIRRPDTTSIAQLTSLFNAVAGNQYLEVTKLGGVWVVTGFGITDESGIALS